MEIGLLVLQNLCTTGENYIKKVSQLGLYM